jgi:hypothetical protein
MVAGEEVEVDEEDNFWLCPQSALIMPLTQRAVVPQIRSELVENFIT